MLYFEVILASRELRGYPRPSPEVVFIIIVFGVVLLDVAVLVIVVVSVVVLIVIVTVVVALAAVVLVPLSQLFLLLDVGRMRAKVLDTISVNFSPLGGPGEPLRS